MLVMLSTRSTPSSLASARVMVSIFSSVPVEKTSSARMPTMPTSSPPKSRRVY
jgi:hypothetical protein